MLLYWKVRYWHRQERCWLDRILLLPTDSLDVPTKAALEYVVETRTSRSERDICQFRKLFREYASSDAACLWSSHHDVQSVILAHYFEDDAGHELTPNELAEIVTGSSQAVLLPHGAEPHDIEYFFADKPPLPVSESMLDADSVRAFGYFARDLQELAGSALMADGPGTLSFTASPKTDCPRYKTAVTGEEIQSYVTVFRRLYMKNEPGSFRIVAEHFATLMGAHPIAHWIKHELQRFDDHLMTLVKPFPPVTHTGITFDVKTILDSFIYTQYAHQPNEKRERQYQRCLAEVGEDKELLLWIFVNEIWKCGIRIGNTGRVIARWFRDYCRVNQSVAPLVESTRRAGEGLGLLEKAAEKQARLFREKVEQLATSLWEGAGRPPEGPVSFREQAEVALSKALGSDGKEP